MIFNVKRFEEYLENENGGDENYGLLRLEKIIDEILGKKLSKAKLKKKRKRIGKDLDGFGNNNEGARPVMQP